MSSSTSKETNRRAALRSQVAALHAEMEIADYGINERTGRSRRKDTRQKQKEKTIKRKKLEKEDRKELAIHGDENTTKRLRGSKVALEDEVVKGSLIFGGNEISDGDVIDEMMGGSIDNDDHEDIDYEDDNIEVDDNDYLIDDDISNQEYLELQSDGDDVSENEEDEKVKKKRKNSTRMQYSLPTDPEHLEKIEAAKKHFPQKKIARTMYRLNPFKSHRMAEKHGDALGRHARGLNRSAVTKLKEVANAAPIAPQVYSSLGLVYESMLNDEMGTSISTRNKVDRQHEDKDSGKPTTDEKDLNGCIELAKKTFGSYHVAALLCKMDYTLWLRAGDAAMKVANLHDEFLSQPPHSLSEKEMNQQSFSTLEDHIQYHTQEKNRWLEEAKDDYNAADNINPPGVAVPAKLAHAHIQLGNLSEALTILTDLKNKSIKSNVDVTDKSGATTPRSDLEKSYAVWMIYANLMLIIGYECNKWNRGDQTNSNYMFRRWLRKYSNTFDWRERRLQSLCLALESAAGTKPCERIIAWMQDRAINATQNDDTYDFDQQATKNSVDEVIESNGLVQDDSQNARDDDNDRFESLNSSPRLGMEELTKRFDSARESLLRSNRQELDQFDKLNAEMNLVTGSEEEHSWLEDREKLVKQHKTAMVTLAGQYRLQKLELESSEADKQSQGKQPKVRPLPPSASCATVCDIASQLMKLCLGMNLFPLGKLTASVISQYLKDRVERIEKRSLEWKSFEKRQIEATSNILQLSNEIYDDVRS